jgi:hypothetical protein
MSPTAWLCLSRVTKTTRSKLCLRPLGFVFKQVHENNPLQALLDAALSALSPISGSSVAPLKSAFCSIRCLSVSSFFSFLFFLLFLLSAVLVGTLDFLGCRPSLPLGPVKVDFVHLDGG